MRNKRADLEQQVIRAAQQWASNRTIIVCCICQDELDIFWGHNGGEYQHRTPGCDQLLPVTMDREQNLRDALAELNEYVDANLDRRGAFNPGSETSENAAISYYPLAGSVRRRIIDEIRSVGFWSANNWAGERAAGLTDDELERRLRQKHTTVSSARNYLVNAGWLTDSGVRRKTTGKRDAIVWELTTAAKKIITSPEWLEATWK